MHRILCVLLGLVLLCTACSSAPPKDVTADTVQAVIDAINADDPETLLALFSEAVRQADGATDAVKNGLADFTDTIDAFTLIGSDTDEYTANGYKLYQTMSRYDLQGEAAHYTLFVSLWHADGEVGYPNDVQMGVHTLMLVEDDDLAQQYDGRSNAALDVGGFHYRPSRLYMTHTTYTGDFCVRDEDGNVLLTNEDVRSAEALWHADVDAVPVPAVLIYLTEDGTDAFAAATRRNLYKTLPMYIGDELIAEPTVQVAIENGEILLTGSDLLTSYADAENLAVYFNTYGKE